MLGEKNTFPPQLHVFVSFSSQWIMKKVFFIIANVMNDREM